jgi:hypothetical protein
MRTGEISAEEDGGRILLDVGNEDVEHFRW